jgi:hypothetical protein
MLSRLLGGKTEQDFEQWWTHSQSIPHLTLGGSTRGPFS